MTDKGSTGNVAVLNNVGARFTVKVVFVKTFTICLIQECLLQLVSEPLLFPHLLSENMKIKIYRNIMSVFCMGVKLGLSHRMKKTGWKVFENRW